MGNACKGSPYSTVGYCNRSPVFVADLQQVFSTSVPPRELMTRIQAISCRLDASNTSATPKRIVLDEQKHRICVDNTALELTRTEYQLLRFFVRHPGQIFSRAQLFDLANQDSLDVTDRAIDTHIKNLRRKLQVALPDVDPIHFIYGLGYRFDV